MATFDSVLCASPRSLQLQLVSCVQMSSSGWKGAENTGRVTKNADKMNLLASEWLCMSPSETNPRMVSLSFCRDVTFPSIV